MLDALKDVIDGMLRKVAYDDDVILLDEHDVPQSAAIRGFLSLFNKSPLLKDLRRCTRQCWQISMDLPDCLMRHNTGFVDGGSFEVATASQSCFPADAPFEKPPCVV